MVIAAGNEISNPNSNPAQSCLHFAWERQEFIYFAFIFVLKKRVNKQYAKCVELRMNNMNILWLKVISSKSLKLFC